MQASNQFLYLYGGDQPWNSSQWIPSDDTVRSGRSKSHLTIINPETARFHGQIDTRSHGGGRFVGQRSAEILNLDLSAYNDGIVVQVTKSDAKRYILKLHDEITPLAEDGSEQSGISWEAEFKVEVAPEDVYLSWSAFRPMYRGLPKNDVKGLDLTSVKRIGLMIRSHFWDQEGEFSIDIRAIAANRNMGGATKVDGESKGDDDETVRTLSSNAETMGWLRGLLGWLI